MIICVPRPVHYQLLLRLPMLKRMGFAVESFLPYLREDLGPHSADVMVLWVVVRGVCRQRFELEKSFFTCGPGTFAILHHGERHDLIASPPGADVYNIYIDLSGHGLPQLAPEFDDVLAAILPLDLSHRKRFDMGVRFQLPDVNRVETYLKCIELELREQRAGFEDAARSALMLFLIDCCRAARDGGFVRDKPADKGTLTSIERVRLRLDREFAEELSLEELASDADVSVGYLCREFRRYTGRTVIGYLQERRVQAAMVKLRRPGAKVLSVATECGFGDLSHFNRTFKRLVGRTPKQVRMGQA